MSTPVVHECTLTVYQVVLGSEGGVVAWWCGGGGSVGDACGSGVDGFHYAGDGYGGCGGGCWWWWAMFVGGVPGLLW